MSSEEFANQIFQRSWMTTQDWQAFKLARQSQPSLDLIQFLRNIGRLQEWQIQQLQSQKPGTALAQESPLSVKALSDSKRQLRQPTQIGPYQIVGELGRGAFGIVYKARSKEGVELALKLLASSDPESIARFDRELRLLRELSAEGGFVPIFDSGHDPLGPYFLMPLLGGGSLSELIRAQGALPVDEVLELGLSLAQSMARAHQNGIIHRDLKPENILFDEKGRPFILDLGLGKRFASPDPNNPSQNLSLSGQGLGSLGFMAPEQLSDAPNSGPAADVFSLGAILYFALTGSYAFQGENELDVATAGILGRFRPVLNHRKDCPKRLAALIESCLAPLPEQRPRDGAALSAALQDPSLLREKSCLALLVLLLFVLTLATAVLVLAQSLPISNLPNPDKLTPKPVPETKPQPRIELGPTPPAPKLAPRALPLSLQEPATPSIQGSGLSLRKTLGSDIGKHAALITRVRTAYEGRIIATAGLDYLVHLWDGETGQRLMSLTGAQDPIYALAFSPDETELLAGDDSGSISILSLETKSRRVIQGPRQRISGMIFIDEGRTLVVAGDRFINFFSWPDCAPKPLPAITGNWITGAQGLCPLSDGLLASFHDASLFLWDPISGRQVFDKKMMNSDDRPLEIHSIAAFPDSKRFVLGLENGDIALLDRSNGAFRHFYGMENLKGHPQLNHLRSVILTPGEKIISGGADGVARRWTSDLSEIEQRFKGHFSWIHEMVALPVEGEFISVGNDGSVRRWRASGTEAWDQTGHNLKIVALGYNQHDQLISAGADGQLLLWPHRGAAASPPLGLFELSGGIVNASFAPDGRYVALSFGNQRILVREVESQRIWSSDVQDSGTGKYLRITALYLERPKVLVGVENGSALMLNMTDKGLVSLGSVPFGKAAVTALTRSRLGDLVAGLATGELFFGRDSGTERGLKSLPPHRAAVTNLLFLDDDHLVSASSDGELRLNELSTASVVHTATAGKLGPVVDFALSPDGRYLAIARSYGSVSIIDWRSSRSVAQIVINNSWEYLNSLAFSRDGKELAVGSGRGLIYTFEFKAPS